MIDRIIPANDVHWPSLSSSPKFFRRWGISLGLAIGIFAIAVGFFRMAGWFAYSGEIVEEALKGSVALLLLRRGLKPAAVGVGYGTFELLLRWATGFYGASALSGPALLYWMIVPLVFHTITGWAYGAAKSLGWLVGTTFLMIGIHFLLNSSAAVPQVAGIPYFVWGAISLGVVALYVFLTTKSQRWSAVLASAWLVPSSAFSALSAYLILTR